MEREITVVMKANNRIDFYGYSGKCCLDGVVCKEYTTCSICKKYKQYKRYKERDNSDIWSGTMWDGDK